jgi:hypothetical protein
MPFRDPGAGDLAARIEAGVRERLEAQVDSACVEAMVRAREARGLPAPRADSAPDRQEYDERIRRFLELLRDRLAGAAGADVQAAIARGLERASADPVARLTAVQLALARALPDYWQRFDDARRAYVEAESASGRERGGLLGRLLGRP